MSNPRIEEVSDDEEIEVADDPDEMDLDAFDFARPQGKSLGQQASAEASASPSVPADMMEALLKGRPQQAGTGSTHAPQIARMNDAERQRYQREQQEKSKSYQCIYPAYFDATRSREQGRRVQKSDAVENPLAREIVEALANIGKDLNVALQIVLEPTKTHPKDWANPGRVKVLVKKDGRAVSAKIQNKHHLYKLISTHLKANPTTAETPMRLQIQGMPMPKDNKITPPAIPRGSKIGTILPLHSPALSGGGVSENFLKDMMAEMGGQLPPGMAGMAGAGGASTDSSQKKVKDKKKK
ncbi:Signal recognition particle sec65 subunit [Fulvia fulva]|uniref:Signal recognition particle sec65 subunit n=1 Tax=Passalora fulva TaxID=5499 RepID=A0A9Q8P5V7_PASFU|nr:Signal recognition particle sec65 subunit [Fulvia fulva]KAK4630983.1 Signal recognition particle sec65 subunit [Fulvia fulva]UJO14311.1 Signal recognition particle sec65 subunit [Fulvia fulva]WPV11138.1 Signal recognition particle sec65 subunit [Fulvia fulva]WPV26375.1 Signal recognition particle sec65 subunit [Fulvia fulva]